MPSLSTRNHFEILTNKCDFENTLPDVQTPKEAIPVSVPIPKIRKSKWEKALPKQYVIATTEQSLTVRGRAVSLV